MPDVGGIAGAQLKSFIERIERLEEEKRALGEDIKEVYAEAKGTGAGGSRELTARGSHSVAQTTDHDLTRSRFHLSRPCEFRA